MTSDFPGLVLSYLRADRIIAEHAQLHRDLKTGPVPLLASLGRVLAELITADRDQPPFPRSTRDGFACRAADLAGDTPLKVVGLLRSGQVWSGPAIETGEALEIMTGAPVPHELDCVLMIEHVTVENGCLRLAANRSAAAGENIVFQGAEAKRGDQLLPSGTRMEAQHIAIAASCGCLNLIVYARPQVAILATGDELVPIEDSPLPYQIRNSNSYSLAAQVVSAGGEPVVLPPAADVLESVEASIRQALPCDLILISGGVSMGKYDFVEQALANMGAEFFFNGALIQPGKPVVFGRVPYGSGHRYFFGLPGNPVSTMITFALFAGPLLHALCGLAVKDCVPDFRSAILEEAVPGKAGVTRFLPASSTSALDGTRMRLRPWQGSGDIAAASAADCFLVVPDNGESLAAGQAVTVLHL